MADIAFLLLIFFLVTTTIKTDKGILHKLPPWSDEPVEDIEMNQRNTMIVLINSKDQLLVDGIPASVDELRDMAKTFLDNRGKDPNKSENPRKAVISLQNDRGTSYGIYLEVQNELKAAYRELRDAYAETKYGTTFEGLKGESQQDQAENMDKIKDVVAEYPMRLSEAEPKEIGGE